MRKYLSPGFVDLLWVQLIATALGLLSFYVIIFPWGGFVTSDGGIQYEMANLMPWDKHTSFYFWGTNRYGSGFVGIWYFFLSPFLGKSGELFYLFHTLFYFWGVGFLVSTVKNWFVRLTLLLILLPISEPVIYHLTMPGQPYNMVLFLAGLLLWVARDIKEDSYARYTSLGLIAGCSYFQYELAGILSCGLISSFFLVRFFQQKATRENLSRQASFFLAFGVLVAFSELARSWVNLPTVHISFVNFKQFLIGLERFSSSGFSFMKSDLLGLVVLYGLSFITILGCLVILLKKSLPKKSTDILTFALLPGTLGWTAAMCLSSWYYANQQHDRYLAVLFPIVIIGIARFSEFKMFSKWFRWALMGFIVVIGYLAKPGIFSPDNNFGYYFRTGAHLPIWNYRDIKVRHIEKIKVLVTHMKASQCDSFITKYDKVHHISVFSNGEILGSDNDIIRNSEYRKEAWKQKKICWAKEDIHNNCKMSKWDDFCSYF